MTDAGGFKWYPYQLRWLADPAPQKAAVKSRRIGLSEVAVFKRVCRACGFDLLRNTKHKPVSQNLLSASHGQAKELLARSVRYLRLFGSGLNNGIIKTESAEIIQLHNGATLRALPTNPRTIRSYGGDLLLDEFGSMPNADEIWAAGAPMAKPTLGNPDGFEIEVIGTPLGDGNLFHRICRGDLKEGFSVHTVDVHMAVADGFPLSVVRDGKRMPGTIDDLRMEIGDPQTFEQEYECSFLSSSMRYISEKLYAAALFDEAEFPQFVGGGPIFSRFAGMDVARERDASAIVRLTRVLNRLWQTGLADVQRNTEKNPLTWDIQESWVDRVIQSGISRMAIDRTGIGSQFAERLVARHGSRIEPVEFTGPTKEELATGLKLAFERHAIRLRADDPDLRRAVLSLRREVTKMGNIRFDAPRTKDGHADSAWALALAVYAAGGTVSNAASPTIHTPSNTFAQRDLPAHVADGYARPKRGAWR